MKLTGSDVFGVTVGTTLFNSLAADSKLRDQIATKLNELMGRREEDSLKEIAEALGDPTLTSMSQVATGIRDLRAALVATQPSAAAGCKGKNCGTTTGDHSPECIAEHEAAYNSGNREPESRYRGYKGEPLDAGASEDQRAAWEEGRRAATQPSAAPGDGQGATEENKPIEAWTWFGAEGKHHLSANEPSEGEPALQLTALVAAGKSSIEQIKELLPANFELDVVRSETSYNSTEYKTEWLVRELGASGWGIGVRGRGDTPQEAVRSALAAPGAAIAAREQEDTKRMDALLRESWDLRCFDHSDGESVGWRVVSHYMAKPHERIVAEVFTDDPREAIDAALASPAAAPSAHQIPENQPGDLPPQKK